MKRLKGPKGSEVKLGVFRPGEKKLYTSPLFVVTYR